MAILAPGKASPNTRSVSPHRGSGHKPWHRQPGTPWSLQQKDAKMKVFAAAQKLNSVSGMAQSYHTSFLHKKVQAWEYGCGSRPGFVLFKKEDGSPRAKRDGGQSGQ